MFLCRPSRPNDRHRPENLKGRDPFWPTSFAGQSWLERHGKGRAANAHHRPAAPRKPESRLPPVKDIMRRELWDMSVAMAFRGEAHQAFSRRRSATYEAERVFEFEEHSDLLSGMLTAATEACHRRAASIRAGLRCRYTGQRLREELAAAAAQARADLLATRAAIRRNFGFARAGKRHKRKGVVLVPM